MNQINILVKSKYYQHKDNDKLLIETTDGLSSFDRHIYNIKGKGVS